MKKFENFLNKRLHRISAGLSLVAAFCAGFLVAVAMMKDIPAFYAGVFWASALAVGYAFVANKLTREDEFNRLLTLVEKERDRGT